MRKKETLIILFNLLLIMGFTGCGKKEDSNTSLNTASTNTTSTQTQSKQDTPPPVKVSQAEETVKNWINALGNRNFKEAHGLMTLKKGGSYSKFCSINGYGGINRTNILNCMIDTENETGAEVVAEYEAFDPANRDGKFKQRFTLVKEGNNWLISDIKKIDIVFYNEKKKDYLEENQVKKNIETQNQTTYDFPGNYSSEYIHITIYSNGKFYYKEAGFDKGQSGIWRKKGNGIILETESFTNSMVPSYGNDKRMSTFGEAYLRNGNLIFDGNELKRK